LVDGDAIMKLNAANTQHAPFGDDRSGAGEAAIVKADHFFIDEIAPGDSLERNVALFAGERFQRLKEQSKLVLERGVIFFQNPSRLVSDKEGGEESLLGLGRQLRASRRRASSPLALWLYARAVSAA
jgi:hypothetical protein